MKRYICWQDEGMFPVSVVGVCGAISFSYTARLAASSKLATEDMVLLECSGLDIIQRGPER